MTWSHDIAHDLITRCYMNIYNHMMHLLFVISRTTSKMIDVYGINICVWYLCYFFHAFFCCFLPVQSMCVFSLVFTSSTAQAAFKGSSVPKQELLLLLFFMGSYLPYAAVAHINKLMTMLTSHIAMSEALVFDTMHKWSITSGKAILCFHLDSYCPISKQSYRWHGSRIDMTSIALATLSAFWHHHAQAGFHIRGGYSVLSRWQLQSYVKTYWAYIMTWLRCWT